MTEEDYRYALEESDKISKPVYFIFAVCLGIVSVAGFVARNNNILLSLGIVSLTAASTMIIYYILLIVYIERQARALRTRENKTYFEELRYGNRDRALSGLYLKTKRGDITWYKTDDNSFETYIENEVIVLYRGKDYKRFNEYGLFFPGKENAEAFMAKDLKRSHRESFYHCYYDISKENCLYLDGIMKYCDANANIRYREISDELKNLKWRFASGDSTLSDTYAAESEGYVYNIFHEGDNYFLYINGKRKFRIKDMKEIGVTADV